MSSRPSRLACVFPVDEDEDEDRRHRKQTPSQRTAPSGCDDLIQFSDVLRSDCSVDRLTNKSKVEQADVCMSNSHLMQTDGRVGCPGGDHAVTWATWGQATSWKDKGDPLCHRVQDREVQGHQVPLTSIGYQRGHNTGVQGPQIPVTRAGYQGGHDTGVQGPQIPVTRAGYQGGHDTGVQGPQILVTRAGYQGSHNTGVQGPQIPVTRAGYQGGHDTGVQGPQIPVTRAGYQGGNDTGVQGSQIPITRTGYQGSHNTGVQGSQIPVARAGYQGGHNTGVQGSQIPVTRAGYQGGHDTGVQGPQIPVTRAGYQGGNDTGVQGSQIPITRTGYQGSHNTGVQGSQIPVARAGYQGGHYTSVQGPQIPVTRAGYQGGNDTGVQAPQIPITRTGYQGGHNTGVQGPQIPVTRAGYQGGNDTGVQGPQIPVTRAGYQGGNDAGVQAPQIPVTRDGYQGGNDTGVQGPQIPVTRDGYQGGHDTGVQGPQIPVTSNCIQGHATSIPGPQIPVVSGGSFNDRHKTPAVCPQTATIPLISSDRGVRNMETYVQPGQRHLAEQGSVYEANDHWSPGKYGVIGGSKGQYKDIVDPPVSQGSPGNQRIESDSLSRMMPTEQDFTVNTPFTLKDIMGEFRSNMNWSVTSIASNSSEDSYFDSRTNPSKGLRADEIPKRMQTEMKAVLSDCKLKSTVACEGIVDTVTPSNPQETLLVRDPAGEADGSEDASLMKMMSNMTLDGWQSNSHKANGVTSSDTFFTGNEKERKGYCLEDDESHGDTHSASHGDNTAGSAIHSVHGGQSGRHFPVLDTADVTGVSRREMDISERDSGEIGKRDTTRCKKGSNEKGGSEMDKSGMARSEIGSSVMGRSEIGSSAMGKSEKDGSQMGRSEMERFEMGKSEIDKIMKDVRERGESQQGIQDIDEIKREKREEAERITDIERGQQVCARTAEQTRSMSFSPLLEDPPLIQLGIDEQEMKNELLNMESRCKSINPVSIMVEDCSDEDSSQFCQPSPSPPPPFKQTGGDTVTETFGQILLDKQRMALARQEMVDHMATLALPDDSAAALSSLKRNQNLTVSRSRQDKSAMAVAVNHSNNVQAVGTFNYNRHTYKVSPSESFQNIKTQSLREIASHGKLFVQTEAYDEVWKVLEEENMVFIVGPPGAGKTMIAKAVLARYHKEQDFEPLILLSVQEMRKMMNIDTKQGIFIKNTFGISDFDPDHLKLDSFLDYFGSFSICVSDNKKFIFTCNNRIFRKCHPHLKLQKIFSKSSVVDLQQVGPLKLYYRRAILYKHLKQRDVILPDDLVDKIVDCASNSTLAFPKCCEIFTKSPKLHDKGKALKFFQKPVVYYKLLADILLQEDDKSHFIVLLLVMVLGELQDSFFKGVSEDSLILKKAQKVLDLLPCEVTLAQLESASKDLLSEGLYLKRSENNDSFIFIDSCVCDAVAIVFGTEYPKHLLQICSGKFLCERVFVNSQGQKNHDEGIFQLESGHFDFLSERFVTEICSGFPYLVIHHEAFGDGSFIKSFKNYCESKTDIGVILTSKDHLHQFPLLFWSSWNAKEYFFKWIFDEHKKRKLPISKTDIKRIARACCISGNVEALKIVFKVVKSSSDMVKDCATISLAIPTCSESSATVSPVEGVVQVGSMLHTACLHGHLPVVELLVTEHDSPVDLRDDYDNTPLTIAAKHGHPNIVQFLINQGAKANVRHPMKKMAIHEACENGRTEVVKVLLKAWPRLVDVPGPPPDSQFPIHFACVSREPQLLKLLLEKGAIPTCLDSTHNTAFHIACCRPGGMRVLKGLKPSMQDLKLQNKFLATCLHLACEFGNPPMVEFLLKKGADVNALNNKQQTPLHVACERNHPAIAEKLLKYGVDVFALDITRKPALTLTTHKKLQKLLIEQIKTSDKDHSK